MATVAGLGSLIESAHKVGNDVTTATIDVDEKGNITAELTFKEGLKEAYKQDAQKLQQALDNSPVGVNDPSAERLQQIFDNSGKVEVEAEASLTGKTTIADIHIVEQEGKLKGEMEIEGAPQTIADLMQQMEKTPQIAPTNQDVPLPTPELNLLQPTQNAIAAPEVQEIIGEDGVIVFATQNQTGQTMFEIKFDEKLVPLSKLESQLQGFESSGELPANTTATIMQEIRNKYPELVLPEQDQAIIVVPPSAVGSASAAERSPDEKELRKLVESTANPQANALTSQEYRGGIQASQRAQVNAGIS